MKILLSNGETLSSQCKCKAIYKRAYNLYKDGYSADESLEIANEKPINRVERNKTVQIDIYYNTLCRINEELSKEIDPDTKCAKAQRMVSEAIIGMDVVGYTNRMEG